MADPVIEAQLVKVDEEQAWWDENPERLEFLNLLLSGATITYSQKGITAKRKAKDKDAPAISRVTLYEWRDHPTFQKRLTQEQGEYERALLQRRARETSQINDRIGKMAMRTADKLDQTSAAGKEIKFDDLGKLERLSGMYTRMRAEERIDLGVDGKTVTHRVGIVGQINHSKGQVGATAFSKLLAQHEDVIDVSMMDTEDPEEALGEIAAQMIVHSGLLEEEEDEEDKEG